MKWERVGASLRTWPLTTLRNTQDLSEPDLTLNISYSLEQPSHCVALSLLFFLNGFETMFTAAIKRSAFSFKPIWNLLGRLASCTIEGFQHRKLHFSTSTQEAERCVCVYFFKSTQHVSKLIFFYVQGGQLPSFMCLSVLIIWERSGSTSSLPVRRLKFQLWSNLHFCKAPGRRESSTGLWGVMSCCSNSSYP